MTKPLCGRYSAPCSALPVCEKMEKCGLALQDSPASDDPLPPTEAEFPLDAILHDVLHQVQSALENMLKMTGEIQQTSCGITEELEKCKESAAEREKALNEEKECVKKAAYAALQMLTAQEFS